MDKRRILAFIGLAARARKIITGEDLLIKGIRTGKVKFVIIAEDASTNTKKKITDKCRFYEVPFQICFSSLDLGNALGKSFRVAVGVADLGFAEKLKKMCE